MIDEKTKPLLENPKTKTHNKQIKLLNVVVSKYVYSFLYQVMFVTLMVWLWSVGLLSIVSVLCFRQLPDFEWETILGRI